MKTLSGILIDPFQKEITYHTFEYDGDHRALYKVLECNLFDIVTLSRGDDGDMVLMFVDDGGLYKDNQRFFSLAIMPTTPFAGKAFIIRENKEGNLESMGAHVAHTMKMMVRWLGEADGLEEAINKGSIERPYSAFGTFDLEDGISKPSNMQRTWEWHPPSKKEGV